MENASKKLGQAVVGLRAQVDPELYAAVANIARRSDRSISAEVRKALRAHVARHEFERQAA